MRKIYEHIDFARVGHYQSILESEGIRTYIKNSGASIGMGEIPFTQLFPELWVTDDADYGRALEVLRPYHQNEFEENPDWECPKCGEAVEGIFGECWNCQTSRPVVDPAGTN